MDPSAIVRDWERQLDSGRNFQSLVELVFPENQAPSKNGSARECYFGVRERQLPLCKFRQAVSLHKACKRRCPTHAYGVRERQLPLCKFCQAVSLYKACKRRCPTHAYGVRERQLPPCKFRQAVSLHKVCKRRCPTNVLVSKMSSYRRVELPGIGEDPELEAPATFRGGCGNGEDPELEAPATFWGEPGIGEDPELEAPATFWGEYGIGEAG